MSARRGTQGRERQEDRPEAVFGARSARRPVWRPSWAPGGPSRAPGAPCRGRLGARPVLSARLERQEDPSLALSERQQARPEAVLGARRPV